jgi:ribosome-binding factor A
MSSRRADRVASAIHQELARMLREDVKEDVLRLVSLVGVSVNPDLSVAVIRWLPLGGLGNRVGMQRALDRAAKYLRGPIGRALGIRHAPELRFEQDRNVEYAAHMEKVLSELPPPAPEEPAADETQGEEGEE